MNTSYTIGQTQLDDVDLWERLQGLSEAQKGVHWIKSDLRIGKFNWLTKIIWFVSKVFPCIRKLFGVANREDTSQILKDLEPQVIKVNNEEICRLFQLAVRKFNLLSNAHVSEVNILAQNSSNLIYREIGKLKRKIRMFDTFIGKYPVLKELCLRLLRERPESIVHYNISKPDTRGFDLADPIDRMALLGYQRIHLESELENRLLFFERNREALELFTKLFRESQKPPFLPVGSGRLLVEGSGLG